MSDDNVFPLLDTDYQVATALLRRCREYGHDETALLDELADLIAASVALRESEAALLRVQTTADQVRTAQHRRLTFLREHKRGRQRRQTEVVFEAVAPILLALDDALDPDQIQSD